MLELPEAAVMVKGVLPCKQHISLHNGSWIGNGFSCNKLEVKLRK